MKAEQYWLLKAAAMVLALAGVLWAQSALQKEVPNSQKILDQVTEPIPAKVDFGK